MTGILREIAYTSARTARRAALGEVGERGGVARERGSDE
jgi:hypothetical protein